MPVSRGGQVYPIYANPGMQPDIAAGTSGTFGLFGANGDTITPEPGEPTTLNAPSTAPKVSTLWYLAGIVILVVALKFAMEHERSGLDPKIVGINTFNLISVSLMAILGIIAIKTVVNKYPVPGLTDLINVV